MTVATAVAEPKLAARVRQAFLECFRLIDLRMLVSDHFEVKLDWVVNDAQTYEAVVFQLIEWAEQQGQLLTLLTAAAQRNGRPELAALRDECGHGNDGVGGGDPAAIRVAVTRFNERYKSCERQVHLLHANKTLHEVLHQLKEQKAELDRLLAAAAGPKYDPFDAETFSDDLRKWVQMADASAPPSKTDRRRKWVAEFAAAVEAVVARLGGAPPAAGLDRKVEWLAHLPTEQQPDLQQRLAETADQMDVVGLGEPLECLRAVLPPDDARELMDRFVAFRGDSGRMKRLTEQHRLCQLIDDSLREATGQEAPTAVGLSQWSEVTGSLGRLDPDLMPDKWLVPRTREAADKFATSPADQVPRLFAALRQRFDRLFLAADNELLKTTSRVIESAGLLDAHLSRYNR